MEPIITSAEKVFTVNLKYTSGTGYMWCLRRMPEEVALYSIDYIEKSRYAPGDLLEVVYTFVVMACEGEEETVYIDFELIRPWEPLVCAEKLSVPVVILNEINA